MPKRFVDSNVFFYAKILDGSYGKSCATIIRKIASKELQAATSALVPIEVANAMRKYHLEKEVADEVSSIFSLGMEISGIEAPDVQEAAEIFADARISPYDCLHVAVMRRTGLEEIISADKDFDSVAGITRVDPKSLG